MLVISFFQWWYSRGFREYLTSFSDRIKDLIDFFSIRLLIRHMFAPFRQISAEKSDNLPLNARIRAWFDLLISRLVGATVRFMILVAGTIILTVRTVIGLVFAVAWPLMPLLVAYCIILFARGVVF